MRRNAFFLPAVGAVFLLLAFPSGAKDRPKDQPIETKPKAAAVAIAPSELALDKDNSSLLTIPAPGRYSIRAKSPTGARIELVDMIAGPLESAGAPGLRDGRIDALLDKGVYKLRIGAVKDAKGKASIGAEPFAEVESARPLLAPGATQSGELGDLQQRSFTLEVKNDDPVFIEAAGRALQDLRVWQADGALADLAFERATIETKPGRFLNRLRLEGKLPAGRYTVTAYGGERLVWSDGAAAQPFMLRLAEPALLAAGVAEGVIGPFGAARYDAPASYDSFRLELPQQAPARLEAKRGAAREIAVIDKASRAPTASVRLPGEGAARVEVAGFEGQPYALRAVRQSNRETFEASGPHLVSVDVAGEGGDEAPLTALFARIEKDGKTQVLASDLPRIGAGNAWRGKFNLLGPVSLLFEATRDGPVVVDAKAAKGVKLRATVEPALGNLAPRSDGKDTTRYDLAAGFYLLTLDPANGSGGVVDLTIGPPGLSLPAPVPAPSRASISFGERQLEANVSYLILANSAPLLLTGPRVVSLPADLAKAPLALHQAAGQELSIPLRAPKDGRIVARDASGADIPLAFSAEKTENDQRLLTAKIAAPEKERALGLVYLSQTPAAAPEPEGKESAKTRASVGRPAFFDLKRDETKNLQFDVAQGGLYRIETLGRMKTALRVGAAVSPKLGEGDANGPGKNGLVTAYLRAGAYRAAVTAKESEGHLGLAVAPAALAPTAKITDAGEARATLGPGKGAIVPFEITRGGDYRIALASLTQDWQARLEDSEGWPLTKPGSFKRETRRFEPGAYRLVVSPSNVEARMVARIAPRVAEAALEGHGPHPLPFEKAQRLQWREPQAKDAPRAPDVWRFTLAGDSDVDLTIGEGMIGEIFKDEKESVGKTAGDRPFKGRLAAGDYRVEARGLSHDDRLDYEIALSSTQLQPGAPLRVDLPARLDFNLAKESVIDLSTFGDKETIGALKTASGEIVERLEPRANDWNVALSRRLPAGSYRLELEELGATRRPPSDESAGNAADEESEAADGAGGTEESATADAGAAQDEDEDASGVEARLSILSEKDGAPLAFTGDATLTGGGAQRLPLPAAPAGSLVLVAAHAATDVAVSIEKRDGGVWRVVGAERGRAPILAWPAETGEWRATVWAVDDVVEPVTVSARAVERRAGGAGEAVFEAVEGVAACVAKIDAPDAALVELTTPDAVAAGSAPGGLLRQTRAGALAPQSQALWLLTRDCKAKTSVAAFEWLGQDVALDIGEGERALLPPLGAPRGKTRLWLARSTFAQPAIDAGEGMGVAQGAALALASQTAPRLWNASGGAMRVSLSAVDVETRRPSISGGSLFAGLVPPMSALPVEMDKSGAPLALDLAGGLAAFVGKRAAFGDGAAVTRVIHGAEESVLLVNMTDAPLPARLSRTPGESLALTPKAALKRFFGAAGQLALPVAAEQGDRLIVAGADAAFVSNSGHVRRGADIALDGPGEIILDYKPGLVAAWIEHGGATPWPTPAARALEPPQRVALEGAAMRFVLKRDAPAMLTASSGAPALVSFTQNGKRETLAFPSGVEFRRYMAAGDATLDVYAPHDGALSGALDIAVQNVVDAHEGVNDAVAVAPGASVLFAFETKRAGDVGIGLRAEPDRVSARLLDPLGKTLGEGVGQVLKLAPGRYFLEARVPPDASAATIRAAIVGISPPPARPPEEVVADLLDKAGMKQSK